MENISVSVVILATDENESLIKTVEFIKNKCVSRPEKIIIVLSRNATKNCFAAAHKMKEIYDDCVKVTVQDTDGLGAAVRFGIEQVETSHMIFFPADLAIELESIDRMVFAAKKEPDIIFKTSRWLEKGSFINYDRVRLAFNFVSQGFLRLLFLNRLTDLTNPVQIIPIEVEKRINWKENSFTVLIEQVIVPVRLGFAVKEVPAKCYPRTEGKSKNSLFQTVMYLKTALRVRFTPKHKLYK